MSALSALALLSAVFVGPSAAQIDPAHAQSLTAYHLNPAKVGAVPINMDTGDALGDLYFYLGQFLLPLECANASREGRAHFDCDNPERVDPNLVVTKVDMQVDSRTTTYSACNLCNGTDPFSGSPCKVGTYICDCFGHNSSCDRTKLGKESIKGHFTPHITKPKCASALQKFCGSVKTDMKACPYCSYRHMKDLKEVSCTQEDLWDFCPSKWPHCSATSSEWVCWSENIPRKTGGYWYSTLKEGLCNKSSTTGSCSWKVESTRTVKDKCLKEKLVTRVESASPGCFGPCGPRNTTSSCWIGCFFDALLGPEARHSDSAPLSGMPVAEIEKAWTDAFLPEEQGGCPVQDIPESWDTPPLTMMVV